jgi:PAS domain S-box-containing protein
MFYMNLAANQQFLDNILSNVPIVIWCIDLNGIFTYSQYKGENEMPENRIGKSALEIYKGTEVEGFLKKVLKGEIQSDTIRVGSIYYDTRVTAIYDNNGIKAGFMGVSVDITRRVETENELKKFRLVLDQAPGAVFILDKNFNFEYINPSFTSLSGYTEEDLLHKNIADTLYKGISEIPESRREILKALLEGKGWQGELPSIHKNGTRYWANTIAAPYKDGHGSIDGIMVIQQDISEKKKMELQLQEKERLYRTLIEKSLDGVSITREFKMILANQAFCDIFGYSMEELKSISIEKIISPKDKDRLIQYHSKLLAGELESINYTATFIHKSEKEIIADVNASTVFFDGENATFVTIRDVTESNRLQQALHISERKYKALTELLPQTVYELDTRGNITFMNQTGLKQFRLNGTGIGISAFNFIDPEDHERMLQNMQKSLSENYITQGNEYMAVRSDGTKFPAMIFATPIRENETVTGTRGILLDMSKHQAMEAALKESEEKYRNLIEKAVDGIIIIQHGRLKFVNRAFCELIGYSEEELLNKSYISYVVNEDHDKIAKYHKRRMKGEDFQTIYRSKIYRKNGSLLEVEMNARTSEYNGEPAAFIIIRDITDRLNTEEKLREAKAKLEILNRNLESRIKESSEKLTEANTQLIRLQKENLQSQFEVLRQQVNPHFLFNSLNVLTSLIKLEPDLAEKFTEHLSKVYRYVLENKDNDLVSLQTELDFLDAYIFLLNIRFMDKIDVNVNIPADKKELLILPLALQLLIENAIKHNSMSKRNPLRIEIFIDSNNILHVENTLQERESHMASTGVGLKNISHRYHLLEMQSPEFIKSETRFIAKIPLK